jgi:hypothetical protein
LLFLFLNLVSCFESSWASMAAFKLWVLNHWCLCFWVHHLFWIKMNDFGSI